MESLLLKKKIVTLKGIKEFLYGIKYTETIGDMSITPNGTNSFNSIALMLCRSFMRDIYSDSVLLKKGENEYPIYFGAESREQNPVSIAYGKKEGNNLILLKDDFVWDTYNNAYLLFSNFIYSDFSNKKGTLYMSKQEKEIYSFWEDRRKQVKLDSVEKSNLDVIEESVDQYNTLFALIKQR